MQFGVMDKFRFGTFCFQYVTYLVQFVFCIILEGKKKKKYETVTEVYYDLCIYNINIVIIIIDVT